MDDLSQLRGLPNSDDEDMMEKPNPNPVTDSTMMDANPSKPRSKSVGDIDIRQAVHDELYKQMGKDHNFDTVLNDYQFAKRDAIFLVLINQWCDAQELGYGDRRMGMVATFAANGLYLFRCVW